MQGQEAPTGQPFRHYSGNKPSNTLLMDKLSPKTLVPLWRFTNTRFVQGSLWNINSFDQWGVELGKKMANELLGDSSKTANFDPSTEALFAYISKKS